ncbi:MAG: alpha/beta hydrolase [Promethearchaeota archaeon]
MISINRSERTYKKIGNIGLKLFIFKPSIRESKELLPIIVFFHGGGWNIGTPKQFFPHCEYFSSRGMISISAEYRIGSKHKTTPIESVMDGKSAIIWIRNHSLELIADPQMIVGAGGSSGGHVALCTAFVKNGKKNVVDSKPNALVLFNPVVDTVSNPNLASLFESHAKKLSPIHNIKKGYPPIIIFHGTMDSIIPFRDVELFCLKMKKLDNRCELVLFENKNHAFFNYGFYKNEPYKETLHLTDKFLVSLGFLKGEPTI